MKKRRIKSEMNKKELYNRKNNPTIGNTLNKKCQLVIGCSKISLYEQTLDLEIDITNNLGKIEMIDINGIKFHREKEDKGNG